jgi:hypothetical protein
MDKTIAIHQPMYFPYLGFFDKMEKADVFIILDDAEYSKGDFLNRNRIKTATGIRWITVPVKKGASNLPINKVEVVVNENWMEEHLRVISNVYKNAPYYNELFPFFIDMIGPNPRLLVDLNMRVLLACTILLDINVPTVMASKFRIKTTGTQRLVDICKRLDATEYLSGIGGKNYIDESLFKEAGIKLTYQEFDHPLYDQLHGSFIPNLSVIDYLMNVGERVKNV